MGDQPEEREQIVVNGTQEQALERRRVREGLPEGGTWNYILANDKWVYFVGKKPLESGYWSGKSYEGR